jgi:conjugation system TraG family ATPase
MIVIMILAGVLLAVVLLQHKEPAVRSVDIEKVLPVWKLENNCILSKNGDITLCFELTLPEIFTLSVEDYESLHSTWLKAIKVLPVNSILHKQDRFTAAKYVSNFADDRDNFLKHSGQRFFNERPYLEHECYLMLTLKPKDRKPASSALSNLLRKNILPPDSVDAKQQQRLIDAAGQFARILSDSGFVKLRRLEEEELSGTNNKTGLLENYLFLTGKADIPELKDITFKPDWKIGNNYCRLYTLADTEDLPATCSPRISYDRYSTDRTKFSVGFASPAGLLLPLNHIYNQYLVIGDVARTLKRLESKRRRLQSLSAYSRENSISKDATADYLNEAISQARTPIKAHFNLMCWTDEQEQIRDLRNLGCRPP